MIDVVPEFADGGYWYVVPTKTDPETGGTVPSIPAGIAYAAWSWAAGECVIKTKMPLALPPGSTSVSAMINFHRKPRAVF